MKKKYLAHALTLCVLLAHAPLLPADEVPKTKAAKFCAYLNKKLESIQEQLVEIKKRWLSDEQTNTPPVEKKETTLAEKKPTPMPAMPEKKTSKELAKEEIPSITKKAPKPQRVDLPQQELQKPEATQLQLVQTTVTSIAPRPEEKKQELDALKQNPNTSLWERTTPTQKVVGAGVAATIIGGTLYYMLKDKK